MTKPKIALGLLLIVPVVPLLIVLRLILFFLQYSYLFLDYVYDQIWWANGTLLGFEKDSKESILNCVFEIREVYDESQPFD